MRRKGYIQGGPKSKHLDLSRSSSTRLFICEKLDWIGFHIRARVDRERGME